jgi:hypothetical protein
LMLVKQQQLERIFFILVSHKIGEATWWCCNNGLDGSGARKRYYNYICSYNLFLEFSNETKVKRYQRHYHITLILLILQDTLILLEVNRSLRVLDGLVFLFSAVDGVEPHQKQTGDLQINIRYHVLDSLIKWIVKVLTFDGLSTS